MKKPASTHRTTASHDVRKTKSEAPASSQKTNRSAGGSTGDFHGNKIHIGPQGGQYYINSHGNKTYIH